MKKMSNAGKSSKLSPSRAGTYRRFIPDARPVTPNVSRGSFWSKIWLNMRVLNPA